MWAQLVKMRIKSGREEEVRRLPEEFDASRTVDAGWAGLMSFQNQKDPSEYYILVMFESEEAARRNESSPEQQKRVERMMELFEGETEYVDLLPVYQSMGAASTAS